MIYSRITSSTEEARVRIDLTRSDGSQRPLMPDFLSTVLDRAGIDARVQSLDGASNSGIRVVISRNTTRGQLAAALRNLDFRVVE